MKRFSMFLAVLICMVMVSSCTGNPGANVSQGGANDTPASKSDSQAQPSGGGERTEVHIWHDWGGDEEKQINAIIDQYNQSQDKYTLIGLVSGDVQKLKVAIAGGTGPDVFTSYAQNMAAFAEEGIIENLDSLIARDGVSFDDYIPSVVGTMSYKNSVYAIAHEPTIMMLYYNKKMLADAGYDKPPETVSQMMEIAYATTKVDADGTIIDIGFPDFPYVYYTHAFSAALGGRLFNASGVFTPDNEGTIQALNLIREYRTKYGLDKVLQFNDSGKYCDPSDPFFTGHQAMRIDGAWLAMLSKEYGISTEQCDFGVAPYPYPDGRPDLAMGAELTSGIFLMPSVAANKEGGWDFLKWVHEGNWSLARKCFPAKKSLLTNSAYDDVPSFSDFASMAAESQNLVPTPMIPQYVELEKIFSDQVELVATLKATPEEAMAKAAEDGNKLLGN